MVVVVARDEISLEDLRNLLQSLTKLLQRLFVVVVQSDLYDHRLGEADRGGVEAHGVALDPPVTFHLLDSRPTWGARQAHARADLLQAGPGVLLQHGEDSQVELIERHVTGPRKLFCSRP